jgi:hypothetical protein
MPACQPGARPPCGSRTESTSRPQRAISQEFAVRALRAWAAPYVIPVASAFRVFDPAGRITDDAVELQLRTLGAEVVRVASRFANDTTAQRARACDESAERVAAAA